MGTASMHSVCSLGPDSGRIHASRVLQLDPSSTDSYERLASTRRARELPRAAFGYRLQLDVPAAPGGASIAESDWRPDEAESADLVLSQH